MFLVWSPGLTTRFRVSAIELSSGNQFCESRVSRIDFVPFASPQLQRTLYTSANQLKKSALLARDFFKRWSAINLARNYDLIYLYREATLIGPPWIEHRLARMAVPIVFDFDDAIFLRSPSGANKRFSFLKCSTSKTRTICRLAAHVIVGNEYLASYARQYASGVTVIPTTIDLDHYVLPRGKPQNDVPSAGLDGEPQHYRSPRYCSYRPAALGKGKKIPAARDRGSWLYH